jgi:peroxiredoxin
VDLPLGLKLERAHTLHVAPAPVHALELGAIEALRASGIEGRALREGERAPAFALPDQHGEPVALDAVLAHGPAVVLFYRGDWCPFCRLTLEAYAARAEAFRALRVTLLAVSPQAATPAPAIGLRRLVDAGNHVARAYGLAYELPMAVRPLYAGAGGGEPLTALNADGGWSLPLPASFVIAPGGRVLRAEVQLDYRHRDDPDTLLAFLALQPDALWRRGRA